MARPLISARLVNELRAVSTKLESASLSRIKRLELLRRQAQLGDERDAAVEAARRASLDR